VVARGKKKKKKKSKIKELSNKISKVVVNSNLKYKMNMHVSILTEINDRMKREQTDLHVHIAPWRK
jgi:hypothetical protein